MVNPVADALSRISINSILPNINYEEFAKLQSQDSDILNAHKNTTLNLAYIPLGNTNTQLLCDTSEGRPRPLVPAPLRKLVFNTIHSLSHPSGRSTARLLKERFVWPSISRDAKEWTRNCISCQTAKVTRHTIPPTGSLPQPTRRFSHIHVDIVGPLPKSDGFKYLFTIIDRSTRWPDAIPIPDATTQSCLKALLTWIAAHGVPEHISSDRGTPFMSSLWTNLTNLVGIHPHHTTAYHPEAKGMVERWHRSLKASLMATCSSDQRARQLPWVLLGLRTAPKHDDPASPSQRVFGQALAVPGEFFPDKTSDLQLNDLRKKVIPFGPCTTTHKKIMNPNVPEHLKNASHAFIRIDRAKRPLTRPYQGPYEILQWIALERLKPAYITQENVN